MIRMIKRWKCFGNISILWAYQDNFLNDLIPENSEHKADNIHMQKRDFSALIVLDFGCILKPF